MNHCIGIPAAELRVDTGPAVVVATEREVATLPPIVPRVPVFLRSLVQSVFVFTGRMKGTGEVRLSQGLRAPFCLMGVGHVAAMG